MQRSDPLTEIYVFPSQFQNLALPHRSLDRKHDDAEQLTIDMRMAVAMDQALFSRSHTSITAWRGFRLSDVLDRVPVAVAPFNPSNIEEVRQQTHLQPHCCRRYLLQCLGVEALQPVITICRYVHTGDLIDHHGAQRRALKLGHSELLLLVSFFKYRDLLLVLLQGVFESGLLSLHRAALANKKAP